MLVIAANNCLTSCKCITAGKFLIKSVSHANDWHPESTHLGQRKSTYDVGSFICCCNFNAIVTITDGYISVTWRVDIGGHPIKCDISRITEHLDLER